MAENIYKALSEGGGFSLPYLLHIYSPEESARQIHLYVINDNEDLEYGGHTYRASAFNYSPRNDGDTSLEISLPDNDELIDLAEDECYFNIEAVGVFHGGEVSPISQYRHWQGEGTWTGKSLQLKLKKDDRLDMTFPALIFNSYNNRGNA